MSRKSFKDILLKSGPPKKSRAISVRLPPDLDEELQRLAEKSNRTMTDVVIEALRFALEMPSDK